MTRINRYYLNGLIESAREVTPNITILNGEWVPYPGLGSAQVCLAINSDSLVSIGGLCSFAK